MIKDYKKSVKMAYFEDEDFFFVSFLVFLLKIDAILATEAVSATARSFSYFSISGSTFSCSAFFLFGSFSLLSESVDKLCTFLYL